MPKVSVFVPHHHNKKLLVPLFKSLLAMDISNDKAEYVLVDNASIDGSVDFVKSEFPRVRIARMKKNKGFAPALNEAVRGCRSEWVCFLNNDMRVDPDWLANLFFAADSADSPCFASQILNWPGKLIQFAGGEINIFGKGFENTNLVSLDPYEIFFPCGGAMMIRRDIFLKAGGFDDDYFMLFEDVDLGWRLRLLGYKIYMVPDSRVMHRGHASLKNIPYSHKGLYYERNSLATIYKNLGKDALNVVFPLAVQEILLRARGVSGINLPFPYSGDGHVMLDALTSFFKNKEQWRKKRDWIQTNRKVDDKEIFEQFFPHPDRLWAYNDQHYKRIAHEPIATKIQSTLQNAVKYLPLQAPQANQMDSPNSLNLS